MKQQWLRFLLIFIALLPVMLLRDFTPDNELKYLSIADEAIANGNIFAFYNHGVAYADKPPLYIWAVMLCRLLFGEHLMFALSLLSVIPAFVTVYIMDKWTRRYISNNETITGELMLFTAVYFIAPMIVLRMDMLMTMFIVLSLYTFFRMYEYSHSNPAENNTVLSRMRRYRMQLAVYIFMALFTKGPVGILVPVISIIVFLIVKKELRCIGRYLGWSTWAVIAGLCAVWFSAVYIDGGKEYLNNLLFNQTVNRAVDAFDHKKPFYFYGVSYWFSLAPWSLLAFVAIATGYYRKMMGSDIIKLFVSVTASTIVMLSLISSKLEIYLLPCFPFIIYMTATLLPRMQNNIWIKIAVLIPATAFIATLPVSVIMHRTISGLLPQGTSLWAPIPVFTAILCAGGLYAAWLIYKSRIGAAINSVAIALLAVIFTASLSLASFNKVIGMKEGCSKALEMAREKGIENFSYYRLKGGDNFDVYLGTKLKEADAATLDSLENSILFIKTKYIKRDSLLNAAVYGKQRVEYGAFSVIPFEKAERQ